MTFRNLILAAGLCCLALACEKAPASGGKLGDPCASSADCESPFICENAQCALDKRAVCDKETTRCNGDAIESCTGDAGDQIHGNKWVVKDSSTDVCKTGCRFDPDAKRASCAPSECAANATRCSSDDATSGVVIQQCDANGGRWRTVFACPTGCEVVGGQAQCTAQVCEPFSNRCSATATNTTQTCNARGTAWTDSACTKPDLRSCKACGTTGDCASGEECYKASPSATAGVCRTRKSCSADADCGSEQDCVIKAPATTGVCETRCKVNDDCGAGVCASANAQGKRYCQVCDTGETCTSNTTGTGASCRRTCTGDNDCPGGMYCPAGDAPRYCANDIDTCVDGRCTAIACRAGAERCNGVVAEVCGANRTTWTARQVCANGCDFDPVTHKATCAARACTPFETRCNENRQTLETCNARGTAFESTPCGPASVTVSDEASWVNCALGGKAVETEAGGTPRTTYRCNVTADYLAGVTVETIPSGDATCPTGGKRVVRVGGEGAVLGSPVCNSGTNLADVVVSDELRGANCALGGKRVRTKQGVNVVADFFICNQVTATAAAVTVTDEPAGANCALGGKKVVYTGGMGKKLVNGVLTQTGDDVTDYVCTGSQSRCVVADGRCRPKACSITRNPAGQITARETRCSGEAREQCNDTETAFEAIEICDFGCGFDSSGAAACVSATCAPGDFSCGGQDGSVLQTCAADRVSYDFVQYCPAGCEADASTSPATARCKATFCSPLARQCGSEADTGNTYVEICGATGASYSRIESCAQGCSDGFCTVSDARCVPGANRCVRNEAETCVLMANGATQWRYAETCLGGCLNGLCLPGGSVGCAGGANATLACGSNARQPVPLEALLGSASEIVPCDGISRILVATHPLASASGTPVPDGTLVTFSHDALAGGNASAQLASTDASATLPGLQRPTVGGVAFVVVSAPSSCASPVTLTVRAQVNGRATGFTTVGFAAPTGVDTNKDVYVAEDFSSARSYDRTSTTELDLSRAAVVAYPAYDLGTGSDGSYTIGDNLAHDLAAEGYARSWGVTRIAGTEVWIDNVMPSLAPGDEVLITTLWSQSASNIGLYEYRRVASVASGRVILTEPVHNAYGNAGGNADFTDVRTILQRVPQFTDVSVVTYTGGETCTKDADCAYASLGQKCTGTPKVCTSGANTAITAAAPASGSLLGGGTGITSGGSGILAFRASGTVRLGGKLDVAGKGFPAGSVAPTVSSPTRLVVGRAVGGAGSGAVLVSAGTLTFKKLDGTWAGASATISSPGANTAGSGSIMVRGAKLELGAGAPACAAPCTPAVTRIVGGTGAMIRLDYGQIDNNPVLAPTPAPAALPATPAAQVMVGQNGAFTASSTVVYDELAAVGAGGQGLNIRQIDLIAMAGGVASSTVQRPVSTIDGVPTLPVAITVSADNWTTTSSINGVQTGISPAPPPGTVLFSPVLSGTKPFLGQKFKWQASLTTTDDKPVYLRALAFKLNLR